MRRSSLLFPLLAVACMQADPREITGDTPGIPALVDGNAAFAVALHQRLASEGGNVVDSPLSVSAALAMTMAGARGDTATEMHDTLAVGLPDAEFHPLFGSLLQDLERERGPFDLSIANRLFGRDGEVFQEDFLAITRDDYGAELQSMDFRGDPDGSREAINGWVSDETHAKIPDLLAPGLITGDTALVLVNAVYFAGRWEYGFNPDDTADRPFTLADGSEVAVPMMHMDEAVDVPYVLGDGFSAIELPYQGDELAMVMVLPDSADGLDALEAEMESGSFDAWRASMQESQVVVQIPKFELRYKRLLNEDLSALGMPTAFSDQADFSGMRASGGLYIDAVVHEAWISVDESGTEAAAATGVVMNDLAFEPTASFEANRPFLFAIVDKLTGTLVFSGRIADPRG